VCTGWSNNCRPTQSGVMRNTEKEEEEVKKIEITALY